MKHTQGEWKVGVQEPCQSESGSIILENEMLKISSGNDKKWIALVGKVGNDEAFANAKLMAASKELLHASQDAYMMLVTDRPVSDMNDLREKLYRAIQKATT